MSLRRQLLFLVALVAAAFALHCWRLGQKPLWVDEAEAWGQATTGQAPPTHPPLYFRVLGGAARAFGESERGLRLPSALAAALMVAAAWWAAGEMGFSPWARLGVAGVVAFSPYLLLVAQQARMYALAGLWGALFVAAALAWRRRRRLVFAAVAAAAALAGVYTVHSFWLILLAWPLLWPGRDRRAALVGAAALVVVVLLYLPIAGAGWRQLHASGAATRLAPGNLLPAAKAAAGALFYFGAGFRYHPLAADNLASFGPKQLVGLAIAGGAVLAPLVAGLLAPGRDGRLTLRLAGVITAGLLVNAIAPSGAEQLAALFPAFVLIWVAGLARFATPWRLVVAAAWAATAGAGVAHYYRTPCYPLHEEDWRGAGAALAAAYRPGDLVVTRAGPGGPAAVRYYAGLAAADTGREGLRIADEGLAPWLERRARSRRVFLFYGDWGDARLYGGLRDIGRRGYAVTISRWGAGLALFEFAPPPRPPG